MSITYSVKQENSRGTYIEFTGDGSTTVLPAIAHATPYSRPAPKVTATIWTNATPKRENGGPSNQNTGLLGNHGGTAVSVASATHANGKSTITLSSAAANGTVHYGEVVFTDYAD